MVDWFLVDQTIAQLGFYLTTTSQLVLIFLTIFYVRKDLGAYKRLIVLFAAMGIAFASIEFVMYPVSLVENRTTTLFSGPSFF